jgi:hypothetical protein
MKYRIILLFLSIVFVSCAAKIPYASNYPLTSQYFHSHDGMLSGRIPQGWFSSAEDTLAPSLMVWLIKEDFSATIVLKELKLDSLTVQHVKKEGLELLARISLRFQAEYNSSQILTLQEFEIRGKKYCGYEVGE